MSLCGCPHQSIWQRQQGYQLPKQSLNRSIWQQLLKTWEPHWEWQHTHKWLWGKSLFSIFFYQGQYWLNSRHAWKVSISAQSYYGFLCHFLCVCVTVTECSMFVCADEPAYLCLRVRVRGWPTVNHDERETMLMLMEDIQPVLMTVVKKVIFYTPSRPLQCLCVCVQCFPCPNWGF